MSSSAGKQQWPEWVLLSSYLGSRLHWIHAASGMGVEDPTYWRHRARSRCRMHLDLGPTYTKQWLLLQMTGCLASSFPESPKYPRLLGFPIWGVIIMARCGFW